MSYVLRHIPTSKYLGWTGGRTSYVYSLQAAQTYRTEEEARVNAVGFDEVPLKITTGDCKKPE